MSGRTGAICMRLRAWHGPTVGWRQDLHRTRVLRHLPAKLSAPEIAEAIAVLAWIKFRPRRSHR